jgi:DNA-directed RNA polymerase subunit H (RpoH/RPB5)
MMNNTNQQLYNIYRNIHAFYDYRKLSSLVPIMKQDEFIKNIQLNKYVILPSAPKDDKDAKKVLVLLLIYPGTECENKRANMKKFIDKIEYPFAEVMTITQVKVSAGVMGGLRQWEVDTSKAYRSFKSFTYPLFNCIIPEYNQAPKYSILSEEDTDLLDKKAMMDKENLPKIFEHDPQMVWLGARVGDVVRIIRLSDNNMEDPYYRLVIPSL